METWAELCNTIKINIHNDSRTQYLNTKTQVETQECVNKHIVKPTKTKSDTNTNTHTHTHLLWSVAWLFVYCVPGMKVLGRVCQVMFLEIGNRTIFGRYDCPTLTLDRAFHTQQIVG